MCFNLFFSYNEVESKFTFQRPFERGVLTNPKVQKEIIDKSLIELKSKLKDSFKNESLLLIDQLVIPETSRLYMNELIFEEYQFKDVTKESTQKIIALTDQHKHKAKINTLDRCKIVVDCGFSFTEVCAIFEESFINYSTLKRLSVGGKLLSNCFRDRLSYKLIDVSRQPLLIEKLSRKVFKVPITPFEFQTTKRLAYLFPDYVSRYKASVIDWTEQCEENRYAYETIDDEYLLPESYFHSEIIGLEEQPLHEVVQEIVSKCPLVVQKYLKQNIVLTGGMSNVNGLKQRLVKELGEEYSVRLPDVSFAKDMKIVSTDASLEYNNPCLLPMIGGLYCYKRKDHLETKTITRKEYLEKGHYNLKEER